MRDNHNIVAASHTPELCRAVELVQLFNFLMTVHHLCAENIPVIETGANPALQPSSL